MVDRIDEQPDPEQHAMTADLQNLIRTAILKLPPQIRMAVIQREIHQLTYHEIAESLEIPLNTVKVHIHRGRKMLFEIMKDKFREDVGP